VTAMTTGATWLAVAGAVLAMPTPLPGGVRLAAPTVPTLARPGLRLRRLEPAKVVGTCGVVGCVAAGLWRGPAIAAALGLVLAAVTYAVHGSSRRRSADRARTALLAAVRMISAELSAGSLEPDALLAGAAVAGPHAARLTSAASAAAAGDLDGVVTTLSSDLATAPLAAAWQVRARLGLALSGPLEVVERDLSDRLALGRIVAEVLAGPRASAFVLAGLPLVGLALAAQMGAHPVVFLTASAVGRLVLLVGATLAATGLTWSVWLASRAEAVP
jgi:tight adherence protein B